LALAKLCLQETSAAETGTNDTSVTRSSPPMPISISTLSSEENVSSVFLEQIFFRLKKAGIVTSIRGPGGGFYFAQPLHQLTVKQVLEAAGEDLDITFCDKRNDDCERVGECMSHQVWVGANELVKEYFAEITLSSILEKYEKTSNSEAKTHG
jgi:Rrf2 family iron-sulfur cluster assembly transcriptional regulator